MTELPPRASLKGLPQELRDEIYKHAVDVVTFCHVDTGEGELELVAQHYLSVNLLLVDKAIHKEVKRILPKLYNDTVDLRNQNVRWVTSEIDRESFNTDGSDVSVFGTVSSMMDEKVKVRMESIMQTITLVCKERGEPEKALIGNNRGFSYIRSLYFEYSVFGRSMGNLNARLLEFRLVRDAASQKSFGTGLNRYLERLSIECPYEPPYLRKVEELSIFLPWIDLAKKYYENGMNDMSLTFLFRKRQSAHAVNNYLVSKIEGALHMDVLLGFASNFGAQLPNSSYRFAVTVQSSSRIPTSDAMDCSL